MADALFEGMVEKAGDDEVEEDIDGLDWVVDERRGRRREGGGCLFDLITDGLGT